MSKYGKEITKTLFMVAVAAGAFFLFDSLFTQYNYGQTGWLTSNKIIRYSITLSLIFQGILLFIKHPLRKAVGIFLLRGNISLIYYFLFIENSQLETQQSIIIGLVTIITLLLSAYKRKSSTLITFLISILLLGHLVLVLPTNERKINIEDFKNQHQNKLYWQKNSPDSNQIVSIFNPIENTKTSLSDRQANQEFERSTKEQTNISYASPEENNSDMVYITLRDGLFLGLKTQSALTIIDDIDYTTSIEEDEQSLSLNQGTLIIENISSKQQTNIKTPNGILSTTPPLQITYKNRETSFVLSHTGTWTDNNSGNINLTSPGSYIQGIIQNGNPKQFDELEPYIRQYQNTRNTRREENTSDRNKGELGQTIIYYKLRILSLIDEQFKEALRNHKKIGCIVHNLYCTNTDAETHNIKQHRPTPNI